MQSPGAPQKGPPEGLETLVTLDVLGFNSEGSRCLARGPDSNAGRLRTGRHNTEVPDQHRMSQTSDSLDPASCDWDPDPLSLPSGPRTRDPEPSRCCMVLNLSVLLGPDAVQAVEP